MRILHYFLGFPPYRTGGLTKYCYDLMTAQVKDKHMVIALWPGSMCGISRKPHIKKRKSREDIHNYELINPLPVALDEGILAIDEFMKSCDEAVYIEFFDAVKPDVIHIHTLMGVHREFFFAAKKRQIKTVFTTHDYYGLCPRVTLYRKGNACENDHECHDCLECNQKALSMTKIRLMQSPIYRVMKNSVLVSKLRKHHRSQFFLEDEIDNKQEVSGDKQKFAENYSRLREYYMEILSDIDVIHFNSTVAESVYKRYFAPRSSKVISITHQHIFDNRLKNEWMPSNLLRIVYLAPIKAFKGFNVLKHVLDELWDSGKRDFELKLFAPVNTPSEYMVVNENGYQYGDLEQIFLQSDILIAPSVWYETFGFTVLEAISYGVPVIVSDRVGAKDIVGNGGLVVEAGSRDSLKEAILSLTSERLFELRDKVKQECNVISWEQFMQDNYLLYGVFETQSGETVI